MTATLNQTMPHLTNPEAFQLEAATLLVAAYIRMGDGALEFQEK